MGRIAEGAPYPQMKQNPPARKSVIKHIRAARADIACFGLIYLYADDTDLVIAMRNGTG
jgi:hypothetical protein